MENVTCFSPEVPALSTLCRPIALVVIPRRRLLLAPARLGDADVGFTVLRWNWENRISGQPLLCRLPAFNAVTRFTRTSLSVLAHVGMKSPE